MSAELSRARSLLSHAPALLRQQRLFPAVQSLHDGLALVLRQPMLLRAEKDEFCGLLDKACYQLSMLQPLKDISPRAIRFVPGQERELLANLRELLDLLADEKTAKAKDMAQAREARKGRLLADALELLASGQTARAKEACDGLLKEFPAETGLRADIAEAFLQAERYPEALEYLREALERDPRAIPLYNRIGVVLRKMGDLQTAERYYLQALEQGDDPALCFNLGRVYLDWRKWGLARDMAARALDKDPDCDEARKLLAFAEKKL